MPAANSAIKGRHSLRRSAWFIIPFLAASLVGIFVFLLYHERQRIRRFAAEERGRWQREQAKSANDMLDRFLREHLRLSAAADPASRNEETNLALPPTLILDSDHHQVFPLRREVLTRDEVYSRLAAEKRAIFSAAGPVGTDVSSAPSVRHAIAQAMDDTSSATAAQAAYRLFELGDPRGETALLESGLFRELALSQGVMFTRDWSGRSEGSLSEQTIQHAESLADWFLEFVGPPLETSTLLVRRGLGFLGPLTAKIQVYEAAIKRRQHLIQLGETFASDIERSRRLTPGDGIRVFTSAAGSFWTSVDNSGNQVFVFSSDDPADITRWLIDAAERPWSFVKWSNQDDGTSEPLGVLFPTLGVTFPDTERFVQEFWRPYLLPMVFLLMCIPPVTAFSFYRRDMARRRNELEERTRFVATLAHQIKTPVANLRLFAETLAAETDTSENDRRRMMAILGEESRRLGTLLHRLLTYVTDSQSNQQSGKLTTFDLGAALRHHLASTTSWALARGTRITSDTSTQVSLVTGHEDQILDAFDVLLENAVLYSPPGSCVTVLHAADTRGSEVQIADQGPGFSSDDLAAFGQPFYRGSAARKASGDGTGLGLAIARRIFESAGGSLDVSSTGPEGSILRVWLPASQISAQSRGSS